MSSCNSSSSKIDKLDWLAGTWKMQMPDGNFIETWKKENDKKLSGNGYFITTNNDTTFREILTIENKDDTIFYIVKTAQNGEEPVSFKEVSSNEYDLVFENSLHDFPQKILYTRVNDTTLTAKITGTQNGKVRTEEFNLVKQQ